MLVVTLALHEVLGRLGLVRGLQSDLWLLKHELLLDGLELILLGSLEHVTVHIEAQTGCCGQLALRVANKRLEKLEGLAHGLLLLVHSARGVRD